jgi:hypothetical protein
MEPMPRSIALILAVVAIAGLAAAVLTYVLSPELATPAEMADQARDLSDELGLDRAETDRRIAECDRIVEGASRLWAGLVSARYESCLREANLLE